LGLYVQANPKKNEVYNIIWTTFIIHMYPKGNHIYS
jgi:hypothetical protein